MIIYVTNTVTFSASRLGLALKAKDDGFLSTLPDELLALLSTSNKVSA